MTDLILRFKAEVRPEDVPAGAAPPETSNGWETNQVGAQLVAVRRPANEDIFVSVPETPPEGIAFGWQSDNPAVRVSKRLRIILRTTRFAVPLVVTPPFGWANFIASKIQPPRRLISIDAQLVMQVVQAVTPPFGWLDITVGLVAPKLPIRVVDAHVLFTVPPPVAPPFYWPDKDLRPRSQQPTKTDNPESFEAPLVQPGVPLFGWNELDRKRMPTHGLRGTDPELFIRQVTPATPPFGWYESDRKRIGVQGPRSIDPELFTPIFVDVTSPSGWYSEEIKRSKGGVAPHPVNQDISVPVVLVVVPSFGWYDVDAKRQQGPQLQLPVDWAPIFPVFVAAPVEFGWQEIQLKRPVPTKPKRQDVELFVVSALAVPSFGWEVISARKVQTRQAQAIQEVYYTGFLTFVPFTVKHRVSGVLLVLPRVEGDYELQARVGGSVVVSPQIDGVMEVW